MAAGRAASDALTARRLPVGRQNISSHDVKREHERPLQLRSDRAFGEQAENPMNRSARTSHLLQRDRGGVPLAAPRNRARVKRIGPMVHQPQRFLVHGDRSQPRHVGVMHPVSADDLLYGPHRMAAGHGGIEVVVRNNRNLLRYSADLLDRRATEDRGTHGDETALGKQLREDVAFR